MFQSFCPTTPIWNGRGSCEVSSRKRKVTWCCGSSPTSATSPSLSRPTRLMASSASPRVSKFWFSEMPRPAAPVMGAADTLSRQRRVSGW
jgi:hypothetical protein